MNNNDMSALMEMLAKMDRKQLEQGLAKASEILNSKDKDKMIEEIKRLQK